MRIYAFLLASLIAAGPAFAQTLPAARPCQGVDELNIYNPDKPEVPFTTPPYVALTASGRLNRLARRTRPTYREVPLSSDQVACLESLIGVKLTAVRAGTSYKYKLQTKDGTLLLFHVANLVGSEAIVPTQAERLMLNAERFLKDGNREEAIRAYTEVLRADPRPLEATVVHTALGRFEKEDGRLDQALQHFGEALKTNPRYIPALEERASLALDLGLQEEAWQANQALSDLVPNRTDPYIALIRIANQRGDSEEMLLIFRKLQAVDQKVAAKLSYEIPALRGLKSERKQAPTVKDVLEIPLRSRPGGTLLVEAAVNGSSPMTFIIDTGASMVTLREATAKSLGIEIDPERIGMIRTAKGLRKVRVITIDRMEIKGIEAKEIHGVVLDENLGPGVEGLLGQNFLNKINARIDIAKKVMVIE